MKVERYTRIVSIGLAMFSMFFGAGNVVFPLAIGRYAANMNFYAIIGLLLTAVGVPFLGLVALILFDGDYHTFFGRMGKKAGFFLTLLIMTLIGPMAAMPRCIDLSYATLKLYLPTISLYQFSFCAAFLIFLLTVKKSKILDILGYLLSPLLVLSLLILIIKGLWDHPVPLVTNKTASTLFLHGLHEGYNTLDLFASFFFSTVILVNLRRSIGVTSASDTKMLARIVFKASILGGFLLSLVYIGFSYIGSFYGHLVAGVSDDELLGLLASYVLGTHGGLIGNAAASLACLTTAITLAAVFADFMQQEVCMNKVSYETVLVVTVFVSFGMANLGFARLMGLMSPIWYTFYPALITLSICNILYKLYGFKPIKLPVALVLALSCICRYL